MTCGSCIKGNCEDCVDRLLLLALRDAICGCTRKLHDDKMQGEARLQQVADPETGAVYAPGLTVTEDGEVEFNE